MVATQTKASYQEGTSEEVFLWVSVLSSLMSSSDTVKRGSWRQAFGLIRPCSVLYLKKVSKCKF